MTPVEIQHELEYYLLHKDIYHKDKDIKFIVSLIYDYNYVQVLYNYGIKVLYTILEMLENNEMYEQCNKVKKVIEKNNKLTGTNYSTNYR